MSAKLLAKTGGSLSYRIMTTNELFNEFWRAYNKAEGDGCSETRAAALWDEMVSPHLNVPRPLLADPPDVGQKIIIFDLDADGSVVRLRIGIAGISKGDGFWVPFPSLPGTSMDEVELGRWLQRQEFLKDASKERIRDIRIGWIARGEVNP